MIPAMSGMIDAQSLCREFSIEIIPKHVYPQPGQTRALGTIRRIIDKRGIEHARLVLCVLAEGRGNQALIDETSLWAVSDLLHACADIIEDDPSAVLDIFDELPLGPYMMIASELRGYIKQSSALAGMIYLHLRRLRDEPISCKLAASGLMHRASASEEEKGRSYRRGSRHRTAEEKIEIGRKLLAIKAELPHGHFGPWLQEQSDITPSMAHQCMRLARESGAGQSEAA